MLFSKLFSSRPAYYLTPRYPTHSLVKNAFISLFYPDVSRSNRMSGIIPYLILIVKDTVPWYKQNMTFNLYLIIKAKIANDDVNLSAINY